MKTLFLKRSLRNFFRENKPWRDLSAKLAKASLGILASSLPACSAADLTANLYQNSFEQAEVGKVPADFLVLDGAFAVQQEGTNKFLELPGAPLDTFVVLFGPSEAGNTSISARVFGAGKGRRFPAFAVGLNGVSGYKLQITPAKKAAELIKDDTVAASVPYAWESGKWTQLKLQIRKAAEGIWKIEGKAWPEQRPEPADWLIAVEAKDAPLAGKASVAGYPFSGTPIRFDDLKVTRSGR